MVATDLSYSGHNDLLVHGSYDSFWDDYDTADGGNVYPHSFRPAEAYLYGKYYMYHWQGDGSTTQLEFELFHWHGDPEMRAFTGLFQPEQPLSALVGQPSTGDWIFKVVDHAGVNIGTIDDWQLRLTVNEPCDSGAIFFDDFEGGDTSAWSSTMP